MYPINITEAVVMGSFISYKIEGYSATGDKVEVLRRYNDFYLLRKTLLRRWALHIPPIPHKKAVGNKDKEFVRKRCFFLN